MERTLEELTEPPDWSTVWRWVVSDAKWTLTDDGPQEASTFSDEMTRRLRAGERMWFVKDDEQPVGFIAYAPALPYLGCFHGVAVDPERRRTGIATWGIEQVLRRLYDSGVEKVNIMLFTSNWRLQNLLTKLGAVKEGVLRRHVRAAGQRRDLLLMAFLREDA